MLSGIRPQVAFVLQQFHRPRGEGAVLFEQRVVLACLHVVRVRTLSSMISPARMDLTKSGFSWTPGQGFYVALEGVTRISRLTW
ncbi:MAG: hypothetical protein CME15_06725 [Gemmatimonadetes bacterium]|nr:hypothetical protein [Gemmatimonadota bacterium]